MNRLRAPARLACWLMAAAAGGPWLWLVAFLSERHPGESPVHLIARAKIYANCWLMLGGVVWYLAWAFGTLLLPRGMSDMRHATVLHRRFDTAIAFLIPAIAVLFWLTGDPDPRNFRRMMPGDWILLPTALFAALNLIVCIQICCLEHPAVRRATSAPAHGCREDRAPSPAASAPPRRGRGGWRGWPDPLPPQSAGPRRRR